MASSGVIAGGLAQVNFDDLGHVKMPPISVDDNAPREYKPYDGDLTDAENRARLGSAIARLGGDEAEASDVYANFRNWPGTRKDPTEGALNNGEHGYMVLSAAEATLAKSLNLTPFEYAVRQALDELHVRYDTDAKQKAAEEAKKAAESHPPPQPFTPTPITITQQPPSLIPDSTKPLLIALAIGGAVYVLLSK